VGIGHELIQPSGARMDTTLFAAAHGSAGMASQPVDQKRSVAAVGRVGVPIDVQDIVEIASYHRRGALDPVPVRG